MADIVIGRHGERPILVWISLWVMTNKALQHTGTYIGFWLVSSTWQSKQDHPNETNLFIIYSPNYKHIRKCARLPNPHFRTTRWVPILHSEHRSAFLREMPSDVPNADTSADFYEPRTSSKTKVIVSCSLLPVMCDSPLQCFFWYLGQFWAPKRRTCRKQ